MLYGVESVKPPNTGKVILVPPQGEIVEVDGSSSNVTCEFILLPKDTGRLDAFTGQV